MTPEEFLEKLRTLRVNIHHGTNAPNKPLTLLYALSRFLDGDERLRFEEVEGPISELLERLGPPRSRHHPEYPFVHLVNDAVWDVEPEPDWTRGSPSSKALEGHIGGFSPEVLELLNNDPASHYRPPECS